MTLSACRRYIEEQIYPIAGDCARVEAEQILISSLNISRTFLFAYPEKEITAEQQRNIEEISARRARGEPLQYIFGVAPFMGLEFTVRPGVLIPRRDTEVLVENALPYCREKRVLDLCTGTGCIGISVARLGDPSQLALSDLSSDALVIARENAARNGVDPVFYQGDFLNAIPNGIQFDVILSNPPYISTEEMEQLPLDVKEYEPTLALEAGADGLDAYRSILEGVSRVLVSGGYLFFEIGYAQGEAVRALMKMHSFQDVRVIQDYGGQDRVVFGCLI